ncbi:hypothetical protein AB0D67_29755 [Streptosporangium sp. NPDC048047]|uniref:hypothetical protein n=1 Tax=Streptosporangium sp. NPDC048047 TaxID=3155748 RepID=UPI00341B68BA
MLQRTRAAVALTVGVGALALAPSAMAATTVAAVAADPVVASVKVDPNPIVVTGSPVGAEFTFTTSGAGKVDFKIKAPGGDWTSLEVKPSPHGLESKWTATKTFDVRSREGQWSYLAVAHGEDGKEDRSYGRFAVDVRRHHHDLDTRIAEFNAWPEPVRKGGRLNVNGRLLVDGRHGWHGYADRTVDILFRADGSSRWEKVGSDRTDRYGRFSESGTAERSGTWRAVFDGGRGVEGAYSGTDHVRVLEPEPERGASRVIQFNASPEPVRHGRYLSFTGRLQIDDSGWEGYRAKVGLYFKPAGSSKWSHVRNTWSNGSGRLYTKAKAYRSGHWKFVFAGDDDFRPDSSGSDYVRVIRH